MNFTYGGARIVVDPMLGVHHVQFRFPKSKGRRIRKKWRKRLINWRYEYDGPQVLHFPAPPYGREMLIMNPEMKLQLDRIMEERDM